MKILKRKTLAALLALSLLASLLPLGAQPALAAVPEGQIIYVGNENVTSGGYWTTGSDGTVTQYTGPDMPADNYVHYDADTNTLTLHNATIKESVSTDTSTFIPGTAIGVFNQNDASKLTIKLEGSNAIENVSTGIFVLAQSSSTGDATLTITGGGSLDASGSLNGIMVQSNSGDATLTIQSAVVTLTSNSGNGVTVQAGSTDSSGGHTITLSVEGGSLTASGSTGISFDSASSTTVSATKLTVSNNAIVRANDVGSKISNVDLQIGKGNNSSGGIVFDGSAGTVYGDVTLQEDLEIGDGESLTIPEGSSLTIPDDKTLTNKGEVKTDGSGSLTNSGTINNSGTLPNGIGGTVNHAPKITTTTLPAGTVNVAYTETTLEATGTGDITWNLAENNSLPTGLTLSKDGKISGTPTATGTSTFNVKAQNSHGSDSKELSITINQNQDTTAPTLTAGSATRDSETNATVKFTSSEAGSYYYAVVEHDATAPTVGTTGTGADCGTTEQIISLNNLAGAGAKDIYIVVKDAAGNVSDALEIEIPAYIAPTYSISATPNTLNFGSITEGDAQPAAQTVTVKNTGNQAVTLNPPTAENFEIGKLSETTLEPDETATFTIHPKDNLPRGSYSEQIVIAGDNNASATLTATFTVKEPPYTGKYSYELTASVGDHGSLTVDRYATEGEKVTISVTPDEAYKLDDLSVTAGGKEVALTAGGDGTYTFTMPSADVKISATFAEDPDWTEPEEPATDVSDIFLDVAPNAWYKDAVQYAYAGGLMTGVSANEFAPEATTTRAMIVSMLARLEGVESAESAGFADVAANDWYATAVNWAAASGITSGTGDGNFSPNTAITREQLAAILMNYAQYKGQDTSARATLDTYNDAAAISSWANDVMSWAVAEGLLTGVTNDQLQPQGNATRAQVAAIFERFLAG